MSEKHSGPLGHLIYLSSARAHYDEPTLIGFCNEFARSNAALDLTGLLIHIGGRFLQVLEGRPATIRKLMTKIRRDPRHEQVRVLREEKIARRQFSHWSMGLLDFQSPEAHRQFGLSELDGLGRLVENIDSRLDAKADVVRLVKTVPRLMKVYRLPHAPRAADAAPARAP